MSTADYCECTDCESVLSPTAYLVDLLHNFLDVPANLLFPVRAVLANRRPDLLFMKLNCDNAELPIPYLDLVNEILEACVVYKISVPHQLVAPFDPLPNDTSEDATADELAVNPENTNPKAYEPLLKAVYPGTLPFNLWLATIRAYLSSLGTSRYELLRTFRLAGAASDVAIACEALAISAEEHAILSTADVAGTPIADPHQVSDYFGLFSTPSFALAGMLFPVPRFLRFSGLEFVDLLALLRTRYVNSDALAPAQRLFIDTSDPCNLEAAHILNLESDEQLDRIQRFLRLWRKLGVSMLDLDRCLQALGATRIDDTLLLKLSDAQRLAERLNIPVPSLLPLWSPLDTYRYDETLPPYHALFLHKTVSQPIDPCFALTVPPAAPELAGGPGCTPMTISAHLSAIQGALRLRANDITVLAAGVLPNDTMSLANLSTLYRHALLARALRLSVTELLSLRALHSADPFATPADTVQFVDFVEGVRAAGFTIAQLDYLYRDRGPALAARAFAPLLAALKQGLLRIEADNVPAVDPNGELTRRKLMVLYDASTTEAIIGLIQGASVWRTTVTTMPALGVPDELTQKLVYLPASKTLQFTGVMTSTDLAALSTGQSPAFQTAVQQLFQQPRAFIDATLVTFPRSTTDVAATPFLNAALAKTTLLDSAKPAAEKFAFVLTPLLQYLLATLSRDLVTQTLASAFKVESTLARWLLDAGLASRASAVKPAMADFLGARGVDARYFPGNSLAGMAIVRAEPQVDFNWGVGSPDPSIPHASFSAQWSTVLEAPDTQSYTLHVLANDGVRLWLDGQLLIDDWNDQPLTERFAAVELKAGQLYDLTLQYYQATAATPAVHLSWSSPYTAKAVIPSSALNPLDHWRLFHKAALLAGTFQLSAAELGYLVAHAGAFGGLDLNNLPLHASAFDPAVFATWERLGGVTQLRARLVEPTIGIADIFDAPSRAEAIAKLAAGTGWNAGQLDWLAGASALNLADADFRTETRLLEVMACFAVAGKTGMSVQQLGRWAATDMAGPDAPGVAAEIKKAVKANHDDASWIAVGKALNDPLREASRNALVSYLLAHPDLVKPGDTDPFLPQLQSADDLYEYLLIDVQMDACMITSRIKQAICSVQLFVQRCLLGLESEVEPSALSAAHWEWMKLYRLWEAGRKVFMYPENWIEPQLRDDKTPFFKELETDLLKNELNNDNVEAAFTSYLHKLEDVARPEIMGLYVEEASNPKTRVGQRVHVIGRTRTTPRQYHYRCQSDGARWTAWEAVSADIEGNSVLPVVWERRLNLFWPLLTEKAHPSQASSGEPRKYWEIRFAYSEYRQAKWTPKRVLDKALALELDLPASSFSFKALSDGGSLTLQVLVAQAWGQMSAPGHELVAVVNVSLCDGETSVSYASTVGVQIAGEFSLDTTAERAVLKPPAYTTSSDLDLRFTAWSLHTDQSSFNQLGVNYGGYGDDSVVSANMLSADLLGAVPGSFEIIVPHQFHQFAQQAPYFLQDRRRTYFAVPTMDSAVFDTPPLQVQFFNHYDEFVCVFLTLLQQHGVDGLLNLQVQQPSNLSPFVVQAFSAYAPNPSVVSPTLHPQNIVEFDATDAYAIYHWELFFHAPFLIACKLSADQRFAEAHRWFQYIFNPLTRSKESAPQRFWNFLPFHEIDPNDPQNASIQKLLLALDDISNPTVTDEVRAQLREWADDPFNPHLVARLRPVAYQNAVVMKYVDNLVAWADQLFRRDTIETINEATQLYVLAAKVLGRKPRGLPPMAKVPPLNYMQLGAIDEFANALEDALPLSMPSSGGGAVISGLTGGLGVNLLPYFCVPPNPKLLGYWDTIADRLFKIRHCMNIEGVVRQLALYEPTIDPALLVRAAAMGVDISSVLSDLDSPVPYYRFNVMLQKALELCANLKSLGAALLVALEKQDAEELAAMRAGHETGLLSLVKEIKKNQLAEAQRVREGLDKTWELTDNRRQFYDSQLKENGNGLSGHEQEQQRQLDEAQDWQAGGQMLEAAAGVAFQAPDATMGMSGTLGTPVATLKLGGSTAGSSLHAAANVLSYVASVHSYWANEASLQATWERRFRDWTLQLQSAEKELEQIDKQKLAADIRIDIANQEILNHDQQIEDARAIDAFYRDKYTSRELYDWMVSELSALYFQSYQIAYDVAKRAERAYRFERGLTESNFVHFGYWDNMKKGLMAGERLELSLRQMERAYLEQNQREYEITKQVSLQLFDPLALIALKQSGVCEVALPESLFDADYPNHFMRRLKSVSLSLPCVVGPYTSINATLTLLNNKTRVASTPETPYEESADGDDPRFVTNFGAIQSIATSHGQNDNGLFELNFRDERYLPFEGAGAVSRWQIELPRETNAFDVNTLADVVFQLKYTARDGGKKLGAAAMNALTDPDHAPLTRLVSLRHDFPDAWYRFRIPSNPSATAQELMLDLSRERFQRFPDLPLNASKLSAFLIFKDPTRNNKEYKKGAKLRFTITPEGAAPWAATEMVSDVGVLNGTPRQIVDITPPLALPAKLLLTLQEQDVKQLAPALIEKIPATSTGHTRLKMDLIDDLVFVVHYSTS